MYFWFFLPFILPLPSPCSSSLSSLPSGCQRDILMAGDHRKSSPVPQTVQLSVPVQARGRSGQLSSSPWWWELFASLVPFPGGSSRQRPAGCAAAPSFSLGKLPKANVGVSSCLPPLHGPFPFLPLWPQQRAHAVSYKFGGFCLFVFRDSEQLGEGREKY